MIGFQLLPRGHGEEAEAAAGLGDIEATADRPIEHVLLQEADDRLRCLALFLQLAQAVAQVREIWIRQVVDTGGIRIIAQVVQLQVGEQQRRERDELGVVGDAGRKGLRFERADHARRDGAELLVKVKPALRLRHVVSRTQFERPPFLGHEVQRLECLQRHLLEDAVDGKVGGATRCTRRRALEQRSMSEHLEPVIRISATQGEKQGLAAGTFLCADREIGAKLSRSQMGGDQRLRHQREVEEGLHDGRAPGDQGAHPPC